LSALRARPLGPRLGGADSGERVPTPLAFGSGASLVTEIRGAVREQHDIEVGGVDPGALVGLHRAFAGEPRAATLALRHDPNGGLPTLGAAFAGFTDAIYGIAIDVGSTTIAGHLCDLTTGEVVGSVGRMNPQIRFGEDLMSRVSYVMMNPGGEQQLTTAVRGALDELVRELTSKAAVDPSHVLDVVIVGNPIMHHLVLGIDPTPLGTAPFELATDEAVHTRARDLDVDLPNAAVYLLPCIAGHVGADTAAAMLAEGPHRCDHPQLLVDIGTNAEIVLGSVDAVFAASSPTGPAFEGAQISSGQRATVGAIERVRVDRATGAPRVRVIGCDLWSDDCAFESEAPAVTGICGSGIVEAIAELFLAGVIAADGTIGPGDPSTPHIVPDGRTFSYVLFEAGDTQLRVTQNDVRAIQLAKAALRAGIDLLLEHAGQETVTDIRLAGAFGAHIDPLYAMVLGLVPDCPLAGVRGVGNAAGAGAVRALLSGAQRREIETAVRHVVKLETAMEPRFQELFVAAMGFPHTSALTPHLAELVELPERRAPVRTRRRRTIKETP
ncbi:MAG: ASKHA domain-containing protein, partial [Acidimicrobiia bacterium]